MSTVSPNRSDVPTVGIVTIAHGRRHHLEAQAASIAAQTRRPDRYVVVDMGGPDPEAMLRHHVGDVSVVESHSPSDRLPLAAARNLGHRTSDTDVTIFLDVDCVTTPTLVDDYVRAVLAQPGIHGGPVGYLPSGDHDLTDAATMIDLAHHHQGRPQPGQAAVPAPGHELFWSLSFAIDRASWSRVGGFDERFVGYGGEDTDFARTATERDVPIWFLGNAGAFHQYHATTTPPVQHLEAICRNATIYYEKWGEWPMSGWLEAFTDAALIAWVPEATSIVRVADDRSDIDG